MTRSATVPPLLPLLLPILIAGGCSSGPDEQPPENGWHVDAVNARQAAKAAADERVVYRYEWTAANTAAAADPATLTEYGRRHVAEVGRSVAARRCTVVVEPSGDAAVDAARRAAVVVALADLAVPDPAALVRVQTPAAYGTPGEEAVDIDADTPRGGQTNGTAGGSGTVGGIGTSGGLGGGRSGGF